MNNAGYGTLVEAEGTPEDEARHILETNFWGSRNVAIEAMRVFTDLNPKGSSGNLVQISSMVGMGALGGRACVYSARYVNHHMYNLLQSLSIRSKFAVKGFIKASSKLIQNETLKPRSQNPERSTEPPSTRTSSAKKRFIPLPRP